MKQFRSILLPCVLVSLLCGACNRTLPDVGRELVAELHDHYLYKDEIQQLLPSGLQPEDSALMVSRYIREWATDILMYTKARQNISDVEEINRAVEEYRRMLLIHQYQKYLVERQNVKAPSEEEIKSFYDENSSQMIAKENMLKGLFLIVPEDAPHLDDVRSWVRKADAESLEQIDKYTLQNAVSYDYFMDQWMPLSTITSKAPFQINNPAKFISSQSMVEASDSLHHYFLNISEYCKVGQQEPYDLARERIARLLSSKKSREYVQKIERELYDDALASGQLKIHE